MDSLKLHDEVMQVGGNDRWAVRLFAVEPNVAADRVPHPPSRELPVVRDEHRLLIVGIHGHGIVISGGGEASSRRPALMASLSKHSADAGIDIVIQDEAH